MANKTKAQAKTSVALYAPKATNAGEVLPPLRPRSMDHLELAKMVRESFGDGNLLRSKGQFWRWDPCGIWVPCSADFVKQRAQKVISDAGRAISSTLVKAVTDVLGNDVHREEHEFNQGDAESVNLENGELVLSDGEWRLEPHQPDRFHTMQVPIAYDPSARAPQFEAFLAETFAGAMDCADKIACVLEMMGYTLMRHARHEKFVILIGDGANGKSVLLGVIAALCGRENVAAVQPSQFDNRFQRGYLHMKLANIVGELRMGEVLPDAELKSIVSGEPSTVELKHKNPFTLRPYATCWFGTNHMPIMRDHSSATVRRAIVLKFNRTIPPNQRDTGLLQRLIAEAPGILNLILAAYAKASSRGFTMPSSAAAAIDEWHRDADPVAAFVSDQCTRDHKGHESVSAVYIRYQQWHDDNGSGPLLSQKAFRAHMTRLGFTSKRSSACTLIIGLLLN
jgi:putative DNA primase/helicase